MSWKVTEFEELKKSANPELIKDQAFSTLMITSLILITYSFDDVLVL